MVVIIPKDKTRFWRIYLRFMVTIGAIALLFCGFGIFHYQTAESPPQIDKVLFRTWGTTLCIATFVILTFGGPLVLMFSVLIWRRLRGVLRKQA